VDWNLPPGQSPIWTTAFVGWKLRSLSPAIRNRAARASANAADWLLRHIFADAGWGYNELVDSDADSTALGILFLVSAGKTVSPACYACLENFQRDDGGFATYRGTPELGSWSVSHRDVTPTALLALLTRYSIEHEPVARSLRFVLSSSNAAEVWDSFWWKSCLYSTQANLTLLRTIGLHSGWARTRETLVRLEPTNSFERALLLSSLLSFSCERERTILELIHKLVDSQEADGSWESTPMLRVTRRDCFEPWKAGDEDRLYCDQNRLFTTATVMEALSAVR
jgi:squalene cyclase